MVGAGAVVAGRRARVGDFLAPLLERRVAGFLYGGVRQGHGSPEHFAGLIEVLEDGDGGAAQTGPPEAGGWICNSVE